MEMDALRRRAALIVALVVLAGCATTRPLPTVATDNGGCRGVGLDAHIAGNASDPRLVWLVGAQGRRIDVIWPPGFTAVFSPKVEVLDAGGGVVYRQGDPVDGGCVTGPNADGPLLIHPPSGA
jgi:hypothetical protein